MLAPLTEKEFDRLETLLITYGNDYSVINLAELNGFLTALASSPRPVLPEQWLPEVAGGKVPKFKKPADEEAYTALMLRYAYEVAEQLANELDTFEPLFEETEDEDGPLLVPEEWCFGYMRGTQVAGWDALPAPYDEMLQAISLHGLEDNVELLALMSPRHVEALIPLIVESARQIYSHQHQSA